MHSPYHAAVVAFGYFCYDWREVAVNVVEMHHIGAEIAQEFFEAIGYVAKSENAFGGSYFARHAAREFHLRSKIRRVLRIEIFGIIHGKESHLVAIGTEQVFEIYGSYAVAAAVIVEFIYD